jgi:hypothetical protein
MFVSTTKNTSAPFDLFALPFRILRVTPEATSEEVHKAFEAARDQKFAPDNTLVSAYDAILDPSRRLSCELSYPIDSSHDEIEELFALLSGNDSASELLLVAGRLAPLSRANFVAHIAAHRPTEVAILRAIVEAHVCVDPMEVFEILKRRRTSAGFPAPSLAHVNQGLLDLLDVHAQACVAGIAGSGDAVEGLLACTQEILALNERDHVGVLRRLLATYRGSITRQEAMKIQQIENACGALKNQPTTPLLPNVINEALLGWAALCNPLIAFDAYDGVADDAFGIPTNLVRGLVSHLCDREDYDIALKVLALSRPTLRLIPGADEQLDGDAQFIERLSADARMKPLKAFVDRLYNEFDSLNLALKRGGFGKRAEGIAKGLWQVFVKVANETDPAKSTECWMLVRNLAIDLSKTANFGAGAIALIAGLIQHGEGVRLTPSVLDKLREDLRLIKSELPIDAGNRTKPKVLASVVIIALAACAIGLFFSLDKAHLPGLNLFANSPAGIDSIAADEEVIPAVGSGQHYSLGNVRYCRFQEERLRIMKQQTRGPEDVRAFNLLAVDYNSRCSDFFYQDSDVAIATAEINANRQRLAAEAERIMATWPGHTAAAVSAPSTK